MIDVTSLELAIASLTGALDAHAQRAGDAFIRDAAIQRFEYTYELTHKASRRYLMATEPTADVVRDLSFPDLTRLGYARGVVLSEWAIWRTFRDDRNATSHSYDAATANQVFAGIASFRDEAAAVLREIKRRQVAGS